MAREKPLRSRARFPRRFLLHVATVDGDKMFTANRSTILLRSFRFRGFGWPSIARGRGVPWLSPDAHREADGEKREQAD
jgi:hypothetical protein